MYHTRVGACLAEHLDPDSALGRRTQVALNEEFWDYVVLQKMGSLPLTTRNSFFKCVGELCSWIREERATPLLFATWAYQPDSVCMADDMQAPNNLSFRCYSTDASDLLQEVRENCHTTGITAYGSYMLLTKKKKNG